MLITVGSGWQLSVLNQSLLSYQVAYKIDYINGELYGNTIDNGFNDCRFWAGR